MGLLGGAAQNFESKDSSFKSYVQEAAQGQLEEMQTSITSGSATASQRELDAIAFNRLLGDGVGTEYLADVRELAASTPLQYAPLTAMSQAMAPTGCWSSSPASAMPAAPWASTQTVCL